MELFTFTDVNKAHEFHARKKAQGHRVKWGGQQGGYPPTWDVYVGAKSNPGRRLTKAQKRESAKKASAKRRVAVALANFLKKANPAKKYAGAQIRRNKGGSITIIPIPAAKANRGRK